MLSHETLSFAHETHGGIFGQSTTVLLVDVSQLQRLLEFDQKGGASVIEDVGALVFLLSRQVYGAQFIQTLRVLG